MEFKLKITILNVFVFAVAFAFVEAAVVVYLRHLLGVGFNPPQIEKSEILFLTPGIAFLQPEAAVRIIQDTGILNVERIREAFTLIMLGSVAALAGKKIIEQVAYFLFAFGIWDIFYYIFLKLTIGWPKSFSDLDIFFLLPTPWVGPIFVPLLISSIMVAGSFIYIWRNQE